MIKKRICKSEYLPVTAENWTLFTKLMGEKGACGGCWCMYWRLRHSEFESQKGDKNKRAMNRIVKSNKVPGIIGLLDDQPIGWCSVAPQDHFPRLANSRNLAPIDEAEVWSIVCLFILKEQRRLGYSSRLIKSAVDYAKTNGAKIVEAYPYEPNQDKLPDPFVWTGLLSAYTKVGFKEVARRAQTRPIVRYKIRK